MSVRPVIEVTADGSHTLFLPELAEHYHSVNGAIQESKHVFIEAGLRRCTKDEVRIFEVGFGTGLNAFLTLMADSHKVQYMAIEAHPLSLPIVRRLNYADGYPEEKQALFGRLHEVEWGSEQQITAGFSLTKIEADLTRFDFRQIDTVDLIYFDAFAPDKQPEMWSQALFDQLYAITGKGGILVTYCAKGIVRRMMQQAGYKVERLPGPPGKREMLRAEKV